MTKINIPCDTEVYFPESRVLRRISNYNEIYPTLQDFLQKHIRFHLWVTVLRSEGITIIYWMHQGNKKLLRRRELSGFPLGITENIERFPVFSGQKLLKFVKRDKCFYMGNPEVVFISINGCWISLTTPDHEVEIAGQCLLSLDTMLSIHESLPVHDFSGFSGHFDLTIG